jgi:hypothetical protein
VKDRELFMEMAVRLENNAAPARPTARQNTQSAPALPGPSLKPAALAQQDTAAPKIISPSPVTPQATPILTDIRRPDKDDFQVLIPSFVTSQLKEGFEVGFLVFVPFIIVDMVIANILLAMGMQMLSPTVISLPFKLLLFVLVDGWFLIIRGLVLSYT